MIKCTHIDLNIFFQLYVQQYYEASYHIVSGCDQLQDLLIGGVTSFT